MKVRKGLLNIKNPTTGEWEEITAIQGESAYELAVRLGYFTGTEEEFVEQIASKDYVLSEIAKAQLEGEEVDLSGFATKDDLHSHSNKSVIDGISSTNVTNWNSAYTHSTSAHAPTNAQKNSDITKTEIENKLTGNITTHTHSQYLTSHQDLSAYAKKTDIPTVTNDLTNALKSNYDSAYTHSTSTHAPSNAQKNSDITKAEIENKLTGTITSHSHNYLSSVPSEYVTDSELTAKGYATQSYVDDNEIVTTFYGTSESLATDSEKIITVDDPKFVLRVGTIIAFKPSVSNSASNVTLNVNGTGAYPIWYGTSEYTSSSTTPTGTKDAHNFYMFNGTHWVWISRSNYITYSPASLGFGYGVCDTAESTTAKAVNISSYTLVVGGIVAIKFTYGVPANATLNIRTRGAKKIFYNGSAITSGVIKAGDTVTLQYDGTQYQVINIDREVPTKTSELTNDSGFITSIPSEYVTDSELTAKNYLTSIPSEYVTDSELTAKGYATKSYVNTEIAKIDTSDGNTTTGTTTSNLPSYWKTYIDNLEEKIIALQDEGGVNTLQFVWCSDLHGVTGYQNSNGQGKSKTTNVGYIARYCMDKFNIPFFAITGDIMSQSSHSSEQAMWNEYNNLIPVLAPIKPEERFFIKGNHDGTWGSPVDINGDGTMDYYTKNFGVEKTFRAIYKNPSLDRTKVFGEDGMYYYVDFDKYRVYMLNTHTFGDDSTDADGYAIYNGFKCSVYGSRQLQWIADTLMTVKENQKVIFMSHAPVNNMADATLFTGLVNSYGYRTTYEKSVAISNAFWGIEGDTSEYMTSSVKADFTNAKGTVDSYFNGHIHKDFVSTAYSFPMVSITTAGGGDVRDADYTCERIPDTTTETAMDIVTVLPDKIVMTRIGAGRDRSYDRATKVTTYGEITTPEVGELPTLTQGNITSEVGYTLAKRYSTSGGVLKDSSTSFALDKIQIISGDVIRVKGLTYPTTNADPCIVLFAEDGETYIGGRSLSNATSGQEIHSGSGVTFTIEDDLLTVTVGVSSAIRWVGIGALNEDPIEYVVTRNSTDMSGGSSGGDTPSTPDMPTLTQGEITDEITWQMDTRLSSSSGNYSSQGDIASSSDIPVQNGDIIRIYGFTKFYGYTYLTGYKDGVYDTNSIIDMYDEKISSYSNNYYDVTQDYTNVILTITIKSDAINSIRVCNYCLDSSVVRIFRNAELSDTGGDTPTDNSGEITNQITWQINKRLSSSSTNYSDATGIASTSDIEVENGDVIRVYGADWVKVINGTYRYINAYNSSGILKNCDLYNGLNQTTSHFTTNVTDNVLTITIIHDAVTYIRFCNYISDTSVVRVFKNAEMSDTGGGDTPTLTQGEITSEVTWTSGVRLSSSSGGESTSDATNVSTSNFIALNKGDVLRVYGITKYSYHPYVGIYDVNKTWLKPIVLLSNSSTDVNTDYITTHTENGLLTITAIHDSVCYIRMCNGTTDTANVQIFRNAELETETLPSGDITSEVGYTTGKRYSTSTGELKSSSSSFALDKIKIGGNDTIRIKGLSYPSSNGDPAIVAFSEDDTFVGGRYLTSGSTDIQITNTIVRFTVDGDLLTVTNPSTNTYYIGIGALNEDPIEYIVTRNMEIVS